MINIQQLKEKIINNANEYIPTILKGIGCHKIKSSEKEFRAAKLGHNDGTAICVNKKTLFSIYRSSEEIKGDIIVLVEKIKNISYYDSLLYIHKLLNIKEEIRQINLPFDGYFKKIKKHNNNPDIELNIYPESILDNYLNMGNKRFLDDKINLNVQKEFKIGYDICTDRITIPWRNTEGLLVGIMGRYNANSEFCKNEEISKYLPLISFPKSHCLYGFFENYNYIVNNKVYIFEAEKSVLQLKSMGINNGIAVGKSTISPYQKKLILSLFPEEIIIAFDEGINERELIFQAQNLIPSNNFFNCKIGYIHDECNFYLKDGSKKSPTDIGEEKYRKLQKDCLYYIN